MTYGQFQSMCARSFNGSTDLVSAKKNIQVMRCRNIEGMLYTFENNQLVSIDRDMSPKSFSPSVVYVGGYDSDNSSAIRQIKRDQLIQDEKRRFDKMEQENDARRKELQNWKPGQK